MICESCFPCNHGRQGLQWSSSNSRNHTGAKLMVLVIPMSNHLFMHSLLHLIDIPCLFPRSLGEILSHYHLVKSSKVHPNYLLCQVSFLTWSASFFIAVSLSMSAVSISWHCLWATYNWLRMSAMPAIRSTCVSSSRTSLSWARNCCRVINLSSYKLRFSNSFCKIMERS